MNPEEKWRWLMDYCRRPHLPPAPQLVRDEAEKAFEDKIKTEEEHFF